MGALHSISDDRGDESFADDLNMGRGIVSGRVALLLRSTEIRPHRPNDLLPPFPRAESRVIRNNQGEPPQHLEKNRGAQAVATHRKPARIGSRHVTHRKPARIGSRSTAGVGAQRSRDTVTHREVQLPGATALPEEEEQHLEKKNRESGRSHAEELPDVATRPEEGDPGTWKKISRCG